MTIKRMTELLFPSLWKVAPSDDFRVVLVLGERRVELQVRLVRHEQGSGQDRSEVTMEVEPCD